MLNVTQAEDFSGIAAEVAVPSESKPFHNYVVRFAESNYHSSCTCPDFGFRRAKVLGRDERACKHIRRVRRILRQFA